MKINHISLIGPDYKELRDFYSNLLNLKLDFDDTENEYCQFDLGNSMKMDFESNKAVRDTLPGFDLDTGLLLRIEVDNVDNAYKEMEGKMETVSEPKTWPWKMRSYYIIDPVGNLIEIYQKT